MTVRLEPAARSDCCDIEMRLHRRWWSASLADGWRLSERMKYSRCTWCLLCSIRSVSDNFPRTTGHLWVPDHDGSVLNKFVQYGTFVTYHELHPIILPASFKHTNEWYSCMPFLKGREVAQIKVRIMCSNRRRRSNGRRSSAYKNLFFFLLRIERFWKFWKFSSS